MDAKFIVPIDGSAVSSTIAACLRGIAAQRYDEGRSEIPLASRAR